MSDDEKKNQDPQVPPPAPKEVRVNMSDEVRDGNYANFVRIQHTAMDFRLDFAKAVPDENMLNMVARLFMSPIHTKMFLKALEDNIMKYEAQFGTIELTPNAQAVPLHGSSSRATH